MKYGSPSRWLVVPLCLFLSAQLSAQGAPAIATGSLVFDPASPQAIPVTPPGALPAPTTAAPLAARAAALRPRLPAGDPGHPAEGAHRPYPPHLDRPCRRRPFVHHLAGGVHLDRRERRAPRRALPGHPGAGEPRWRARAAGAGLPPALRPEWPLLRLLHRPQRQRRARPLPGVRRP